MIDTQQIRKWIPAPFLRAARPLWHVSRSLRITVSIAAGTEPHSGLPLRILLLGEPRETRHLLEAALGPDYLLRRLRRIWWRSLTRELQLGHDCDLGLVAVRALVGRAMPGHFEIPAWVDGEVTLREVIPHPHSRSAVADLRRLRRHRLEPEVATDLESLEEFYHEMHVPLLRQAHPTQAEVSPYRALRSRFAECEILFIRHEQKRIAGTVLNYSGRTPRLWKLGVRPPLADHRRLGAVAATYHFSFERLARRGHSVVSLGTTRPLLNDGVMRYKRKLGYRVTVPTPRTSRLVVLRDSPALEGFLLRNPFIHVEGGRLRGAVFLPRGIEVDEDSAEALRHRYSLQGLERLVVYEAGRGSSGLPRAVGDLE